MRKIKFLDRFSKNTQMADLMKICLGRKRVVQFTTGTEDTDYFHVLHELASLSNADGVLSVWTQFLP